jgi:hypothetical protein
LVCSIPGTPKGDLESGILNERHTLNITRSKRYQVQAQVDNIKSHFIKSARENMAELYDLHLLQSAVERVELIDSVLADNK